MARWSARENGDASRVLRCHNGDDESEPLEDYAGLVARGVIIESWDNDGHETRPMKMAPLGVAWPLVGRTEELALLRQLRSASPRTSAILSGPAGVGKSRLAREAVAEAAKDGWATLSIRGSAGMAGVPMGPWRMVFPLASATNLMELTECVSQELLARCAAAPTLIHVDDCHYLDDATAAVLHQAVATDLAVAILSVTHRTQVPVALTDLWKDGLAERLELQNLSHAEIGELLEAALGAPVQDSSANRMWQFTQGNPQILHEVVLASVESGALRVEGGEWRWRGGWSAGSRIQEIVAARLGALSSDENSTMEFLAVAGSLPLAALTSLVSPGSVGTLAERDLISSETRGKRTEVTVTNPLCAEVVRSRIPPLRQLTLRRALVTALIDRSSGAASDRVRIACWSLEMGLDLDPVTLALGKEATLFGIGQSVARRLREIVPTIGADDAEAGAPIPQDHVVAIRLARAEFERVGGLAAGVELASTLAYAGEIDEAEAALTTLAEVAVDVDDRTRVALALAWIRFWVRFDVDQTMRGLRDAATDAERLGAARPLLAEVYATLAGVSLNVARPSDAWAYATRAAGVENVALSHSRAAPAAAAALAYLGRNAEAIALVDAAVPVAHERDRALDVAQLLVARSAALSQLGRLEEARTLAEWLRNVALADGLDGAAGIFGVVLGEFLVTQGRPASAAKLFRDASSLLLDRDQFGYRPWALAGLARALAQTGDEQSAVTALAESRQVQQTPRHFDAVGHLAEIEIHRLAGRTATAVATAATAAAWARGREMAAEEVRLLAAWLRVEASESVTTRLIELAAATDSPLVAAHADHARALADDDPTALLSVSERFESMSRVVEAVDAAAAAAESFHRRGGSREAQSAVRRADQLAAACEGFQFAPITWSGGGGQLTPREREVASLAARGHSNREIAERLFISARTAENHLYHAYTKLGVTDRAALAEALKS
jgi:DNA-binding CsgD family transcriptional regulator